MHAFQCPMLPRDTTVALCCCVLHCVQEGKDKGPREIRLCCTTPFKAAKHLFVHIQLEEKRRRHARTFDPGFPLSHCLERHV